MKYLPVASSIIIPHAGAFLGAACVSEKDFTWYQGLKKPKWCPPQRVYAPIWAMLHTGMGYSSYLIWRECGGFNKESALPLALYGSTLTLNWVWAPTFFIARSLKWAFVEAALMAGTASACLVTFSRFDRVAGGLMAPYLLWVTMATALVYRIWRDNPPAIEAAPEPESKDNKAEKKA